MLPLVTTMPLSATAFTALTLGGARCGTKICQLYQHCSSHNLECEDCAPKCDRENHNFEEALCQLECRDYLLGQKFVSLSDYAAEIKHLKIYLTVTFILTLIILVLFLALNGRKIFRFLRNSAAAMMQQGKKKNKPAPEPVTMANPNTESPKMRRNQNNNQNNLNRTSSIFTVSGTEYDQKTVSTPISRHPAEDTLTSSVTGDYSYDNKALQLTPTSTEKPKIETNF